MRTRALRALLAASMVGGLITVMTASEAGAIVGEVASCSASSGEAKIKRSDGSGIKNESTLPAGVSVKATATGCVVDTTLDDYAFATWTSAQLGTIDGAIVKGKLLGNADCGAGGGADLAVYANGVEIPPDDNTGEYTLGGKIQLQWTDGGVNVLDNNAKKINTDVAVHNNPDTAALPGVDLNGDGDNTDATLYWDAFDGTWATSPAGMVAPVGPFSEVDADLASGGIQTYGARPDTLIVTGTAIKGLAIGADVEFVTSYRPVGGGKPTDHDANSATPKIPFWDAVGLSLGVPGNVAEAFDCIAGGAISGDPVNYGQLKVVNLQSEQATDIAGGPGYDPDGLKEMDCEDATGANTMFNGATSFGCFPAPQGTVVDTPGPGGGDGVKDMDREQYEAIANASCAAVPACAASFPGGMGTTILAARALAGMGDSAGDNVTPYLDGYVTLTLA
jgi:hypothetical protein